MHTQEGIGFVDSPCSLNGLIDFLMILSFFELLVFKSNQLLWLITNAIWNVKKGVIFKYDCLRKKCCSRLLCFGCISNILPWGLATTTCTLYNIANISFRSFSIHASTHYPYHVYYPAGRVCELLILSILRVEIIRDADHSCVYECT